MEPPKLLLSSVLMRFSICPKIESGRLILSEDRCSMWVSFAKTWVVMMQPEIKNKQQTLNIHVQEPWRHENVKGDTQRINAGIDEYPLERN